MKTNSFHHLSGICLGVFLGAGLSSSTALGATTSLNAVSAIAQKNKPGITAAGDSFQPFVSRDGSLLIFVSQGGNLVSDPTDPSYLNIYAKDLGNGSIELISINASGNAGGLGSSGHPSVSSNSHWVCFASDASDLVANDTNGFNDVFVRDRATGTTVLISVNEAGQSSTRGQSSDPVMSEDGRWVAFLSDADDLVSNDTNGIADVFLRDLLLMQTHLVSVGGTSSAPNTNPKLNGLSISQDGTRVAFGSGATNYHPAAARVSQREIYVRDISLQETRWVSSNAPVVIPEFDPNEIQYFDSVISPDGQSVVYKASTNILAFFLKNRNTALLHYSLESGETIRLADQLAWQSQPCWSRDGSRVVYATISDVFMWDRDTGQTQLISVGTNGQEPGNGPSFSPVISGDGTKVAFVSYATNLVPQGGTGLGQVYLRDLPQEITTLISANLAGEQGNKSHGGVVPSLDETGMVVAFDSVSDNLIENDFNGSSDVFVRSMHNHSLALISEARLGSLPPRTATTGKYIPVKEFTSRDGRYVAFISPDEVFDEGDTNGFHDVYVRDVWENKTLAIGKGNSASFPEGLLSGDPIITADGRMVFFTRRQSTFTLGNAAEDVEIWSYDLRHGESKLVRPIHYPENGLYLNGTGQIHVFLSANEDGTRLLFSDNKIIRMLNIETDEIMEVDQATIPRSGFSNLSQFIPHRDQFIYLIERPNGEPYSILMHYDLVSDTSRELSKLSVEMEYPFGALFRETGDYALSADGRSVAVWGKVRLVETDPIISVISWVDLEHWTNQIICVNCQFPSLSGNGMRVVYEQEDSDEVTDIVLLDLQLAATNVVSLNRFGTNSLFHHRSPQITHDGRYVVFASGADDLVAGDSNGQSDIFVRDTISAQTYLVSQNFQGTGSGNQLSINPKLGADGRTILFESFASDLIEGDYNDHRDIFMLRLGSDDSDEDGMDDDFEYAYFGTLERDGAGDWDGDGHTDREEFQAGTNPSDDESILRVMTLTMMGTGATKIMWSSVPGKSYRVQARSNFVDDHWADFSGDIVAMGATAMFQDTSLLLTNERFYRVVLQP